MTMNEYLEAEKEFELLVAEVKPFNFSDSRQVSRYIIDNQLGYKYRFISGHLDFENGSDNWTFKGGICPEYYRRLCQRLNLGNKRTSAVPKRFVPFNELLLF